MLRLVRSLVELTGSRARRSADGFLLPPERFALAATAERMRVDRNGSMVSLLVIEPAVHHDSRRDIHDLERRMAARLRLTDTAGWLDDSRIGVLLPDTPEAGAWKVASDLCAAYPAGPTRPECGVLVYPSDDDPGDGGPTPGRADDAPPVGVEQPTAGQVASSGALGFAAGWSAYDDLLVRQMPLSKRLLDVVGATVGLVISTPLIAVAAVAIRLTSRGPAFFLQEREGLGGKRFRMVKLRTMRQDAETLQADLRPESEQDGPAFKIQDDPRVTTVGRILRRTSIDELPQFLNVLLGDMSLVGPRPLPTAESQACQPWQRRRLHVTPGLTCTWQIHGRNVVPFDDWIRMDLAYAKNRSLWLDFKLVAQTGPTLIRQKGR